MNTILKFFFLSLFTISVCIVLSASAQNLTVPQIMAEPSIAGMRAEGEKLSPDGKSVVFLWNAEGKLPRDLYLSPTDHSEPKVILRISDLPKANPSPTPENKLTYGLTIRDDFVKSRENQLGNFEWSPDSKKLLFSQGGDLYVLNVASPNLINQQETTWNKLEAAATRFANIAEQIRETVEIAGGERSEALDFLKSRASALKASLSLPNKGDSDRAEILRTVKQVQDILERILPAGEIPKVLANVKGFREIVDELYGLENRINVARTDYYNTVKSQSPKRYTKTQSPEVGARFLDSFRVLFQQSGNLFVLNTADSTLTQLTKEANTQTFISVTNATPNKDGTLLAYVVSDSSKQKPLFVPNYLDDFVQAPTVRRGWSEQKVFVVPADGSRDAPFEIKLPKPEGMSSFRRMVWAADGRSLIVDRIDKDTKRRQLFYIHNVGSKDEQTILVTEETDDKWIAPFSAIVESNPKESSELFFGSERDGFNHLYLARLEKNPIQTATPGEISGGNPTDAGYSPNPKITQLTKGAWQVEWAKWANGDKIIYMSTEDGSASRSLERFDVPNLRREAFVDNDDSMLTGPQLSDNSPPVLLFSKSRWNVPDELIAVRVLADDGPPSIRFGERLTQTVPAAFRKRVWNEPKFIDIPSRDGKPIKSKIYLSAGFDQKKKYPMVIFVHGAGYLQNTINGWNNYYREFMFNELLTQRGYVVLDIDYRGSAGYGREWRTDVYDFLGGKDMDDHIDGIDFMVKNYAVDPAKVGVYGGSYGGFMAEMLAFRAPDKIAAAAALRPVADWKNYYASSPQYTAQRLGFPDKNPEAYKRSSPISYADQLRRPLLILHGMSDDNVHVQDSQQLIEKLVRLGKTQYFEAMLYPSENHGFVRPESWTDEYERILAFFEKHLK